MNDTMNGIITITCLGAIYFHWIKFELKTQFDEQLKEVEQKLEIAIQSITGEADCSEALTLLNQAVSRIHEIREVDWTKNKDLDALIVGRQKLYFINHNTDCAINRSRKTSKVNCALFLEGFAD